MTIKPDKCIYLSISILKVIGCFSNFATLYSAWAASFSWSDRAVNYMYNHLIKVASRRYDLDFILVLTVSFSLRPEPTN